MNPILTIRDLTTAFKTKQGEFTAVDRLSLNVGKGEIVGLVGESGCGKSVTSLTILKLLDDKVAKIKSGQIIFSDEDLLTLPEAKMRKIRGNKVSMIFQEPMTSLNPVFTIGDQIAEVFLTHKKMNHQESKAAAIEMLRLVNIPDAQKRYHEYPHQLSGGMRQRVMIAMALACRPLLLIADEPTTALDVTIQAQILELMGKLRSELGMSILLITHDLGVVAEFCERVYVMYAGRIVESATVKDLFREPTHPYTIGLLASIPSMTEEKAVLSTIRGQVPSIGKRGTGCLFADRCDFVLPKCKIETPMLENTSINQSHQVACFNSPALKRTP